MRIVDSDDGWRSRFSPRFHELIQFTRKSPLFIRSLTMKRAINGARSLSAYLLRRPDWVRYPIHVKLDVAPRCQLKCPVCTHGNLQPRDMTHLPKLMKQPLFERVIDAVAQHTSVLSLYNLGEPLLNPALAEMISYATHRGMSTYITTNLSLKLSPERIEAIVTSGLTLMLVAIDGISKDTFGKQRIGGNLDLIVENIRALTQERHRQRSKRLRICLQFLVFDFNRHEKSSVAKFARALDIDEVHFVTGAITPWVNGARPKSGFNPRPAGALAKCAWPYFSAVVLSNGQVAGCCKYRMNDIYEKGQTLALGNVEHMNLGEIYRGPAYRIARAMSASPAAAGQHVDNFCNGCGSLYLDEPAAVTPGIPSGLAAAIPEGIAPH